MSTGMQYNKDMKSFVPLTIEEMQAADIIRPDFVLVSGDPYIDHPSFGTAVIARILENVGYSVCIIAQPDWKSKEDFKRFGEPRLAFLITSGSVDSMVANYTANKRRRRSDNLSPGGKPGKRPDRALIVYSNRCREAYKNVPVIIGGIEASLRRLAHYDYWDNKVRRSVLLDSKSDILVYGMGEKAIAEIADALNDGFDPRDIRWISGTAVRARREDLPADTVFLPPYIELTNSSEGEQEADKYEKYNESFVIKYDNNDHISGKPLAERYDEDLYVLQNPPQPPLTQNELDAVYALPFVYDEHPSYKENAATGYLQVGTSARENPAQNGIPALHEIKFSIAHVRGCFGNCAFCAITAHQGRVATGRSIDSVVREAELMTKLPDFKGYIHDIGGPTANFRGPACKQQLTIGTCKKRDCLYPEPCKNLEIDHSDLLKLLKAVRSVSGVKKAFIRSGIRYDYVMADRKSGAVFIHELAKNHVSGMLKTAPEHICSEVLSCMRKPPKEIYEAFADRFTAADDKIRKEEGRKPQFILPYFISAHPGSSLSDAFALATYIKRHGGFVPDQIQDFYPTPGTLATCTYYTGKDPFTGKEVYIPNTEEERRLQRALLQYNKPENRNAVQKALKLLNEEGQLSKEVQK